MAGQAPRAYGHRLGHRLIQQSWLTLLLVFASLNFSPFVTAAFITPLTYTAYLDQADVRFHCTTVNARDIDWCIDGEIQNNVPSARGITTEVNPTARNESNLNIPATAHNNNTHIQCLAIYDTVNRNYTPSNESTFYVQGELANLTNI